MSFDRTILSISFFHTGSFYSLERDIYDVVKRYGNVLSIIHKTRKIKSKILHEFDIEFKRSYSAKVAAENLRNRTLDSNPIRTKTCIMKIWN